MSKFIVPVDQYLQIPENLKWLEHAMIPVIQDESPFEGRLPTDPGLCWQVQSIVLVKLVKLYTADLLTYLPWEFASGTWGLEHLPWVCQGRTCCIPVFPRSRRIMQKMEQCVILLLEAPTPYTNVHLITIKCQGSRNQMSVVLHETSTSRPTRKRVGHNVADCQLLDVCPSTGKWTLLWRPRRKESDLRLKCDQGNKVLTSKIDIRASNKQRQTTLWAYGHFWLWHVVLNKNRGQYILLFDNSARICTRNFQKECGIEVASILMSNGVSVVLPLFWNNMLRDTLLKVRQKRDRIVDAMRLARVENT